MAPTNRAAWLKEVNKPLEIASSEIGKPGEDEVLVKNHAVAINPVDWMQQYGAFPAGSTPRILGNDIAGEIVEVGPGVADFQKGQRVLGHCSVLNTNEAKHGGFQEYTVVSIFGCAPIPDTMSYEDACVLPLAISTASLGLFQEDSLALRPPGGAQRKSAVGAKRRGILVWGGSSSVGTAAIQLAVAAGYAVVATASPQNFPLCRELGATKMFDHSSKGVVGDVLDAMQAYHCEGAFDAISTRDTQLNVATVLAQLGGGKMAVTLPAEPEIPATVNAKMMIAAFILTQEQAVGKMIYQGLLPKALQTGRIKPAPKPEVVGSGIESIQKGVDLLKKGVSGKKVVVKL